MEFIEPQWPAPDNIKAVCTLRTTGNSTAPYDCFNLANHVGDDSIVVNQNRQKLISHCHGLETIQWLDQVHGIEVFSAQEPVDTETPSADAAITADTALACAVLTADCLPLLICDESGTQVAAAHAGWRGLAAGVIENTVAAFDAKPENLLVWLGPAISQMQFETGPEVKEQIQSAATYRHGSIAGLNKAFIPTDRENHFYADLYELARVILRSSGVERVYGGDYCTYSERDNGQYKFYSFRRDGTTGRIASLIYKC